MHEFWRICQEKIMFIFEFVFSGIMHLPSPKWGLFFLGVHLRFNLEMFWIYCLVECEQRFETCQVFSFYLYLGSYLRGSARSHAAGGIGTTTRFTEKARRRFESFSQMWKLGIFLFSVNNVFIVRPNCMFFNVRRWHPLSVRKGGKRVSHCWKYVFRSMSY